MSVVFHLDEPSMTFSQFPGYNQTLPLAGSQQGSRTPTKTNHPMVSLGISFRFIPNNRHSPSTSKAFTVVGSCLSFIRFGVLCIFAGGLQTTTVCATRVWVKIKPPGDHRFGSMFPLTRVPFWGYPIFDPQPQDSRVAWLGPGFVREPRKLQPPHTTVASTCDPVTRGAGLGRGQGRGELSFSPLEGGCGWWQGHGPGLCEGFFAAYWIILYSACSASLSATLLSMFSLLGSSASLQSTKA